MKRERSVDPVESLVNDRASDATRRSKKGKKRRKGKGERGLEKVREEWFFASIEQLLAEDREEGTGRG